MSKSTQAHKSMLKHNRENYNKPGIYKIVSLLDGMYYIGSTKRGMNERFNNHISSLRRNKHQNLLLQKWYNIHGIENFKLEKIEEVDKYLNTLDLNIKEEKYILEAFKVEMDKVFNRTSFTHRNSTIIYNTSYNEKLGLEKDLKNHNGGNNKKKVIYNSKGEYFDSIKCACSYYDVGNNSIRKTLNGVQKTTGGLEWYFYEGDLDDIKHKILSLNYEVNKPIYNNTGVIFASISQASKESGLSMYKISNSIKTNTSIGKYQWYYYEKDMGIDNNKVKDIPRPEDTIYNSNGDYFTSIKEAVKITGFKNIWHCLYGIALSTQGVRWAFVGEELPSVPQRNVRSKYNKSDISKVYNNRGEVFDSVNEASSRTNVSVYHILKSLSVENHVKGGYKWYRYEEEKGINPEHIFDIVIPELIKPPKHINRKNEPVYNSKGDTYNTIKDAVKDTGISGVWHCVYGKQRTTGGLRWAFVGEELPE